MKIPVRPDLLTDPRNCNGCGVCMLSCPVWRQHHTQSLTYCGRNRATIGGAADRDLTDSAGACVLCGSCEALCPMGIQTQQATLSLRKKLSEQGLLPESGITPTTPTGRVKSGKSLLLPGAALLAHPSLLQTILNLLNETRKDSVHIFEGYSDLARGLESGNMGEKTLVALTAELRNARELIVSDGLLFNFLFSVRAPAQTIRPLGPELLSHNKIYNAIRATDFYMIETRAYNARHRESVTLYDGLRNRSGCFMNLDLHRVATPTGGAGYLHLLGLESAVSVESQVQWLLEGKNPERIVVEHLDDHAAFARYTPIPVIHLAEVLHD